MSEFLVRYLAEEEYSTWDSFVDHSEYGSVFHKYYWNKAVYALDPSVSIRVIGCLKEGKLVAGMVVGSQKKFGFIQTMVPPYASSFYGLLIKERESEMVSKAESFRHEVLDALLRFTEKAYQISTFSLPPGFRDIRSFNWRNYSAEVIYTYRSDLRDPELLFNKFLPSLRRQIKKGEKLKYEIREPASPADLATVYDLLETSYRRQEHAIRFSRERFYTFMDTPALKNHLKVHSIWWENKPVAVIVLLVDGNTAYYWLAGGDHQYFNTGLNQVLLWQVIRKLHDSGFTTFDFIGANTPSISKYKSGYNFDLVSYYRVSKESGRMAGSLMVIKKLLRGS